MATPAKKKTSSTDEDNSRKTIRFSVDLSRPQHTYLRSFANENQIQASIVMRALIYRLEVDEDLANRVIDEIFSE